MNFFRLRSIIALTLFLGAALCSLQFLFDEFIGKPQPQLDVIYNHYAQRKTRPSKATVPNKKASEPLTTNQRIEFLKKRYGRDLDFDFLTDNQLASIEGKVGRNISSVEKFTPEDPKRILNRAKSILSDVSPLLSLKADSPLGDPRVQVGSHSAQVYYSQSYEGTPLVPYGALSINLGPKGELLGLYSEYVPNLKVSNEFRISIEEGQRVAVDSIARQLRDPLKVDGARKIIWIKDLDADKGEAVGLRAYEYTVSGYQIVVDAQEAKVVQRRDRRIKQ